MFDFLYSEDGKARRHASHWLEMAERVYDYRRDLLTAPQLEKLQSARTDLQASVKAKAVAKVIQAGIERLEKAMRECGGRLYPLNSMVENVEFFLVAAIVILGLRAYFVQPFKIPTNSMWPSYYGMKAETFTTADEPGLLKRAGRLLAFGARHYTVEAPADGEVMVRVFLMRGYLPRAAYTEKPGRSMFIFPATMHRYEFSVAGQTASVEVPSEFENEFGGVMDDTFRGEWGSFAGALQAGSQRVKPESEIIHIRSGAAGGEGDARVFWVATGKHVRKGEKIVSFDILSGDLLFVERVSYNFFAPKVGSGFVFKTENIHSEEMQDPAGNQIRQYFVKRLAGTPGDKLEIHPPELWRNGQPIEGSAAYGKNARREGLYPGYTNGGLLGAGDIVTVPEHSYMALGDNSPNSKDSRSWGFVPEKDVVGRPLFIYYPLTKRWGLAH